MPHPKGGRWSAVRALLVSFTFLPAGLAALFAPPSTQAAIMLTVQESGGAAIPIADNGPLDVNAAPGRILVNTGALNPLLVQFQIDALAATSNVLTGVPFSNDPASLTQTGEVTRTVTPGAATLSVIATDTDFLFPAGNPKFMGSSASDTFSFTTAGNSRTFQSFFDPANVAGGMTLPSPLLAFVPPVGPGPFGAAGNAPLTLLGTQPIPFALTNQTIITMGASQPGALSRNQFAGATIVLPEPASALLVAVTAACCAIRRRRHGLVVV